MVKTHVIKYRDQKGVERFEEAYCSMDETGECEGCDRNAAGDKRVGPRQDKAAFSVVDLRWHGRTEGEEFNGEKQFYLDALPADQVDPFESPPKKFSMKRGKETRTYTDIVRTDKSILLLLAMGRADALGAEEQAANRKCRSCGGGKLSVTGYKIEGQKRPVPELEDGQEGTPIYECKKCDDPDPFTIFGPNPTFITRSGSGKTTTYSFKLDMTQDMDDMGWVKELEKLDLEAVTAPTAASRYEKVLGGGKTPKAEKEIEDDDETPKDDDDDDSLYNKTEKKSDEKKPKKKLLKKK